MRFTSQFRRGIGILPMRSTQAFPASQPRRRRLPETRLLRAGPTPATRRAIAACVGIFCAALIPSAGARTINFSCPVFSVLKDSSSQPLPADFVWELGAFTGNFTPTPANVDQWRAHWTPAARSLTNLSFGFFSRDFVLASNAAPFNTGNRGWIWGYGCGADPGQWVLIGASGWTWPTADPFNPFIISWATSNATATAVVGTLNATAVNPNTHIATAPISGAFPPAMPAADWRALTFEAEIAGAEPNTALDEDFDGDGSLNLMEFALGTDPKDRADHAAPGFRFQLVSGSLYALLSVERNPCADVTFTVQRATDLTGWTTAGLTPFADEPDLLEVRETAPQSGSDPTRGFLRLHVAP
jgi:hypothetical protein